MGKKSRRRQQKHPAPKTGSPEPGPEPEAMMSLACLLGGKSPPSNVLDSRGECDHGFPRISRDGATAKWITGFLSALNEVAGDGEGGCPFSTYYAIVGRLKEPFTVKESVTGALLSLGTEYLLIGDDRHKFMASTMALYTTSLSQLIDCKDRRDGTHFAVDGKHTKAYFALLEGELERETTRFYKKRIRCTCLNDIYAKMRSQPRTFTCSNCMSEFDLTNRLECQGCAIANYCEPACQQNHWPAHKALCKPVGKLRGMTQEQMKEQMSSGALSGIIGDLSQIISSSMAETAE